MLSSRTDLPRTRRLLEQGIDEGLHLGAQVFVSRLAVLSSDGPSTHRPFSDGTSFRPSDAVEFAVGESRPGRALRRDDLMLWLSASKPITALAVAQLWEAGRLDLDDPVARHLPEFGVHGKEEIRLRHLLTHTAGLRMLSVGFPERSWNEILAAIAGRRPEPRWPVGERAGYHPQSTWFLLGEIVARLHGAPFAEVVRREIFEPLGMNDSWIGMPLERFEAYGDRLVPMHKVENEALVPRTLHDKAHVTASSPAGGGWGPIRDLARLFEMLLRGGSTESGARLLTPQTIEALVSRHRVGLVDRTFRQTLDWGLGFLLDSKHYGEPHHAYGYGRFASRRTFGHGGAQSSIAFADPEHRLTVVIATNGQPGEERNGQRFQALVEAVYRDLGLAPNEEPSTLEASQPALATPAKEFP